MSDIAIAHAATLRPIKEIAAALSLDEGELIPFGHYKAKLPLTLINREQAAASRLILVTAMSPTPAGEGKTTVSIGLSQGLNRIGKSSVVVLREPSLGPVFGIKGGAAGGGYSQVLPMEDINLHFTGDFSAIEKAHNLLAALIDNAIQARNNPLQIDARTVLWKRVTDMNDRALRKIVIGLGGTANGVPRESGFDITAASEIMAILCLAEDRADLKRRLGSIFIGYTLAKEPVYARDLDAEGAMAALLKDALQPNLVQTIEGGPAIIHGGPFANIAQGTNSVIATRMGMTLSDYVVTEAGFGADLGAEKFFNIKCVSAGLKPRAVVLVATLRALKHHGGAARDALTDPDIEALKRGLPNLEKHIENVTRFGLNPVVAINAFASDTEEERQVVQDRCRELGVRAVVADVWGQGGRGAEELARVVAETADATGDAFRPLYDWSWPVREKIATVAREVYGADHVEYGGEALKALKRIEALGLSGLPVCMAKTQYSFSDTPGLLGRPEGFTLMVRDIEIAAGAGFLIPITGQMMRMPGLPAAPAAGQIDINEDGEISGLF